LEACPYMLAILGGSGLTQFPGINGASRRVVRTPYGEPSGVLTMGTLAGCDVVFLARHGNGHTIPPHRVNFRANLWALHEQGARQVIAVATVGGIGASFVPGSLAVPDQIIDYTHGRDTTLFDSPARGVMHIDFTQPYTEALRQRIMRAARRADVAIHGGGVYACTQGPRLETAAEIDRLARDGCDVVGMTGMPEAVLARELDLQYAAIVAVVNHAAGRGDSSGRIDLAGAEELSRGIMQQVIAVINELAADNGG